MTINEVFDNILECYGTLAQLVEHLTFNQVVGGSIPPCLIFGELIMKKLGPGNIVFWIILGVLFLILTGMVIYGTIMTNKYSPTEEEIEQAKQEAKIGVKPNNDFLAFCNDEKLYAVDANFASNPVTSITVVKDGTTNEISDAARIADIWSTVKAMKIADVSDTAVTPAEYTLTLHRATGSDATVTFQSPTLLTVNGVNYVITDSAGVFDKL